MVLLPQIKVDIAFLHLFVRLLTRLPCVVCLQTVQLSPLTDPKTGTPLTSPEQTAVGVHIEDLEKDAHSYGKEFKREYPFLWWATLIGPLGGTVAALLLAWGFRGWEFMVNLFTAAAMIFFGLGRAVLLLGRDGGTSVESLEHWQRFVASMTLPELFTLIVWMDVVVAFIIVYHASFIYRIPKFGPAMLALQEDAQFFLSRHPALRRFAWAGLVLFVVVPFAGTGSVGGSIVGRLLGLSRFATLCGVIAGSIASTAVVYFFAAALKKMGLFDASNPWMIGVGIGFTLGIVALLNWRYQTIKKQWASGRVRPGVATARHDSTPQV